MPAQYLLRSIAGEYAQVRKIVLPPVQWNRGLLSVGNRAAKTSAPHDRALRGGLFPVRKCAMFPVLREYGEDSGRTAKLQRPGSGPARHALNMAFHGCAGGKRVPLAQAMHDCLMLVEGIFHAVMDG